MDRHAEMRFTVPISTRSKHFSMPLTRRATHCKPAARPRSGLRMGGPKHGSSNRFSTTSSRLNTCPASQLAMIHSARASARTFGANGSVRRSCQVRNRLAAGGSRIRTLSPGATKPEIALSSGQTAGTMAGARPLIRSTNREANRQARPLVINARR
jgi:hypothetical protein